MTEIDSNEKYSLQAEWYDAQSGILRKFFLHYFRYDNTIELFDRNRNRVFLKRIQARNISLSDIFIGNTVEVFSRHIKLIDYANEFTRKNMGLLMQKTLAIIKPDGIKHKGSILKMLCKNDFKISKLKMLNLPRDLAEEIFEDSQDNSSHKLLVSFMMSGPVIALELVADQGGQKLRDLAGPEDPKEARATDPETIRGCFGTSPVSNAIHIETDESRVQKAGGIIFGPRTSLAMNVDTSTFLLKDTTCCVVKAHAIKKGHLGEIVSMIEENHYTVTAMEMFYLDGPSAEEFLEVYKGVVQEYGGMVAELMSGGCVAMEIQGPMGPDTPIEFRKLVGPSDPDLAKQLRPNTIRAKFGVTSTQNAVHVTDLPEDAMLEVEYFFKILNY